MIEKLQAILERMKAAQANFDTEAAHGDADKLLIEALSALGYQRSDRVSALVNEIIDTYNEVGKWYA